MDDNWVEQVRVGNYVFTPLQEFHAYHLRDGGFPSMIKVFGLTEFMPNWFECPWISKAGHPEYFALFIAYMMNDTDRIVEEDPAIAWLVDREFITFKNMLEEGVDTDG